MAAMPESAAALARQPCSRRSRSKRGTERQVELRFSFLVETDRNPNWPPDGIQRKANRPTVDQSGPSVFLFLYSGRVVLGEDVPESEETSGLRKQLSAPAQSCQEQALHLEL